MTAPRRTSRRFRPVTPTWQRATVLLTVLILVWAALLPPGRSPAWWHGALAAALIIGFLGSWHRHHLSTIAGRWVPMALRNRRGRIERASGDRAPNRRSNANRPAPANGSTDAVLHTQVVIHLRPQPHALTVADDHSGDQLPWDFITAWLHRYGVRADALTISSVTRTPPASGLRSDAAALLTGRTPQHRDTWLTYTLSAASNIGALAARRTVLAHPAAAEDNDDDTNSTGLRHVALAETMSRRLIAELRERGWLATLIDSPDQLPRFLPEASTVRREYWAGVEYSDGFRSLYAVNPNDLRGVLEAMPTIATKATWVTVAMSTPGTNTTQVHACVGTLTAKRPAVQPPVAGLIGFHGRHRQLASALTIAGLGDDVQAALPPTEVNSHNLTSLVWPTSAAGVPIGYNRQRQPMYLGLASPEQARVTVTGSPQFQMGITARLALSGLPVAVYTADHRPWVRMANHGAPQQFAMAPTSPPPGAIIVSDGSSDAPNGAIMVALREPQTAQPPATTIVITQHERHHDLFDITTGHGHQMLSTRL